MNVQPGTMASFSDEAQDLEFQNAILHLGRNMKTCPCELCVRISGRLKFRTTWYVEEAS